MESLPDELKRLIMSYAMPIHPCKEELEEGVDLEEVPSWTRRAGYWTAPLMSEYRFRSRVRAEKWRVY